MNKKANKGRNRGKSTNTRRMGRSEAKNERRDVEIENTAKRELLADERLRRDFRQSKENSWEWYAQNSQLIKDYASYPFGVAFAS